MNKKMMPMKGKAAKMPAKMPAKRGAAMKSGKMGAAPYAKAGAKKGMK